MQNQRAVLAQDRLYTSSFDCFIKVIRNEGPRGLYRGMLWAKRNAGMDADTLPIGVELEIILHILKLAFLSLLHTSDVSTSAR